MEQMVEALFISRSCLVILTIQVMTTPHVNCTTIYTNGIQLHVRTLVYITKAKPRASTTIVMAATGREAAPSVSLLLSSLELLLLEPV